MRKKIYNILNKTYAVLMSISFFGGLLPLIPFIIAMIIGGEKGELISNFLLKQYYPWVIIGASVSVIIGLIAMYINKIEAFSTKSISGNTEQK